MLAQLIRGPDGGEVPRDWRGMVAAMAVAGPLYLLFARVFLHELIRRWRA